MRSNIGNKEWSACLASLRDARALILRDAESFHEAATTLEQIGRVLSGEIRDGLKRYKSEILGLANSVGELEQVEKSERLFNTVCDAIIFRYMLGQLRRPDGDGAMMGKETETTRQRRDALIERLRGEGAVRRF